LSFLETDLDRGSHIVPFVLFLQGQPIKADESLERDDLLSLTKLMAEATPAEHQMILDWVIDMRQLLIALPENKYVAWVQEIDTLLHEDRGTHKALKQLNGHLNHAGFIIPALCHFLG
jgi:hypothetical protein